MYIISNLLRIIIYCDGNNIQSNDNYYDKSYVKL